ncbi:MAG: peptidyl-prolyl cis-trans isomerase [Acidobacteria bacterium]|nr:peptidyl-prolyl cis-trans isomerase [Acidobacteriota bacterium]
MGLIVVLAAAPLAAADTPLIATYRDGTLGVSEFEAWKSHRQKAQPARDGKATPKDLIEDLVILKVLVDRFDASGLGQSRPHCARLDFQRWGMAEKLLRTQVVQASRPSDADLKAAFDADPGRHSRPRQWQLENIFKRWPDASTEATRETLRRQMHELRRRILEGEDFGTLARLESDSQTRLRGGRLGLASLDELQPEVSRVVATMEADSLSPVIETPAGLTLLRCTQILEAKSPSFEEARDRLSKDLKRRRFKEAWGALDRQLVEEFRPTYRPERITTDAPETAVVATLRKGETTKEISLAEYRVYLGRERVRQEAPALSRQRHLQFLGARVLLEARALEAARRGLDADQNFAERLAWKQLELKARIALDEAASLLITYPTDEEVEALYGRRREELIQEERLHLRTLELAISRALPREIYDQFENLGERLANGEIDLDAAAQELKPPATVVDLGWKTPDQIWLLGRNVEDAVKRLEPGHFSGPVQEGQILRIIHLVARRKQRTPSLGEARPRLVASLIAARRLKAEESVRRAILAEQKIEVMP